MTNTIKKAIISAAISAAVTCSVNAKFDSVLDSAPLGFGNKVTLEASPLNLSGDAIVVGEAMPNILLKSVSLGDVYVSESKGKVKVYSVVPSLDSPVCDEQVNNLSNYVDTFKDNSIEFYVVSADTSFAQARFANEAGINSKIVFLSDSVDHTFGANTGTQIEGIGLLTRTTIVVDKENTIRYIQRVPELTTVPSLDAAMKIAEGLN